MNRQRLSISVDPKLAAAAERAVSHGMASSLSAWVNDAMALKIDHDRRLEALATAISSYEAEQGEITDDEIRAAERSARERARVVRGRRPSAQG